MIETEEFFRSGQHPCQYLTPENTINSVNKNVMSEAFQEFVFSINEVLIDRINQPVDYDGIMKAIPVFQKLFVSFVHIILNPHDTETALWVAAKRILRLDPTPSF